MIVDCLYQPFDTKEQAFELFMYFHRNYIEDKYILIFDDIIWMHPHEIGSVDYHLTIKATGVYPYRVSDYPQAQVDLTEYEKWKKSQKIEPYVDKYGDSKQSMIRNFISDNGTLYSIKYTGENKWQISEKCKKERLYRNIGTVTGPLHLSCKEIWDEYSKGLD